MPIVGLETSTFVGLAGANFSVTEATELLVVVAICIVGVLYFLFSKRVRTTFARAA